MNPAKKPKNNSKDIFNLYYFLIGASGALRRDRPTNPQRLTAGRRTGLSTPFQYGYSTYGLPYRTGLIVQDTAPLRPCLLEMHLVGTKLGLAYLG